MPSYVIRPKAPLLFRSGQPFGQNVETLAFPMPSTVAGALRTAYAEQMSAATDYDEQRDVLKEIPIRTPLLAKLDQNGQPTGAYFPMPADGVYLDGQFYAIAPGELPENCGCDLPERLMPLFLDADAPKAKPDKTAPSFWSTEVMNQWLLGQPPTGEPKSHGTNNLPIERRTHVRINPETLGTLEGQIFQTSGLDFGWNYALLAQFEHSTTIKPTLRRVGGEARLAFLEETNFWPTPPNHLFQQIAESRKLRLILATPAIFGGGYRPSWIDANTFEG